MKQIEKDIMIARQYINGEDVNRVGYDKVKLITDKTLKALKRAKATDKKVLCKIDSPDIVLDLLSYNNYITCYSDNRFNEYFLKLKLAALVSLDYQDYYEFFMTDYKRYSKTFSYDTYRVIRKNLDERSRYFFDELLLPNKGKMIRKSDLFEKDIPFTDLCNITRCSIKKHYYETKDKYTQKRVKFIYSKDEKIASKLKQLYDVIYLSNHLGQMSENDIIKANLLVKQLELYLSSNGKIIPFIGEEKDVFEKYSTKPLSDSLSKDKKDILVYTYKKESVDNK